MSIRLLHKKSSVSKKTPSAEDLLYGELAINYAASAETFSIKNSENEVITFPMYKIEKMSEDLSVLSGSVSANTTLITNEETRATKAEEEIQKTITTISNNLSTVSDSLNTFLTSEKIEGTVDTLKEIQEFIENNGTTDIIKDINTINENITNISGDIIANTQSIDQANDDILTLQTTISSVSGVVNTISGDVNTINSTITSIQKNINNLSSTTLDHTTQLTSISSQLDNVASDFYTFLEDKEVDDTVDTLNEIQEFINTVNDNVSILSGDITTVSGKSISNAEAIDVLSGAIDTNIANIEAVSSKADANAEEIEGINANIIVLSGAIDTNIANIEAVSGSVSTNTSAITRLKGEGDANPHVEPFKKLNFEDINDILPYFQDIIANNGLSVNTYNRHIGEYRIFIDFYMYNVKFAVDMENYTATITVSGTLDIDGEELVISPNYSIAECQCVYDEDKETQEWSDWKLVASSTLDNDINAITDDITTISGSVSGNSVAIANLSGLVNTVSGKVDTNIANIKKVSSAIDTNTTDIDVLFEYMRGANTQPNQEGFTTLHSVAILDNIFTYFNELITDNDGLNNKLKSHKGTYRATYLDNVYWIIFGFSYRTNTDSNMANITICGHLTINDNSLKYSSNYSIVERIYTQTNDTREWSDWKIVVSSDFQEQIINNQNMVNDLINRISILESKQNMVIYTLDAQGSYANDVLTINNVNGIEINATDFNNTYDSENEMLQ